MAELARRSWLTLRNEHISRMARNNDTGYIARASEFLSAAYYDICTGWHHFELDKRDTATLTCSTSSNLVDASALGIHSVFGVQLRDPTSDAVVATLEFAEARFSLHKFRELQRQPTSYSRYGNDLVFPFIPDKAYPVTLHYYADCTPPDFDAPTTPELAREWDEHILELSLALAHGALWQREHAAYWQERFDRFAALATNPPLIQVPQHGSPQAATRTFPHGGAQG